MVSHLSSVAGKTFDFVVVGSGPAGLTVASRLSEDPSVSVVVLEAGEAHLDDPIIIVPGQYGCTFFNPKYDWAYPLAKKGSENRDIFWNRGKGLGGSSIMNFMVWMKPAEADWNSIEELGNPGWNWADFVEYSCRTETFHDVGEEKLGLWSYTGEPKFRGTSGPIHTTLPHHPHSIDLLFAESMKNKNLKHLDHPYGGDVIGTSTMPSTMDPRTWTRSYATTAHYLPNKDRPNLVVITGAHVCRVIFKDKTGTELTASGVEFIYNGEVNTVFAKKEVILSAGAIGSPQILELSGVGRSDILSKIGVDVKIDLPGVGENIQDHVAAALFYELDAKSDCETLDLLFDPEYAAKQLALYKEGEGIHTTGLALAFAPLSLINPSEFSSLTEKAAKDVKEQLKGSVPPGLAEQLDIQLRLLKNDTVPDFEFVLFPGWQGRIARHGHELGKRYITLSGVGTRPLSRGTIHVCSKDPLEKPEIDPHSLENDFDVEIIVQHLKFIRDLALQTEPLKSHIVKEAHPGVQCDSDEKLRAYIRGNYAYPWHTVGSTSMLPREKHGVVDPSLKVYGTTNLRVVDLGVIPLLPAAHPQSIAYTLGEKAADIIRHTF